MKILICDDEQTYLNTLKIHIDEYIVNVNEKVSHALMKF